MAEKMLVTQALDERDLLAKKIMDKIRIASFTDTRKRNETNVMEGRISSDEFKKNASAAYQQIMDLIERFRRMDTAIITSNATTVIDTSIGQITVATAISIRNRLRGTGSLDEDGQFEEALLKKMEEERRKRVIVAETKNKALDSTAETMRLSILGKDTRVREERPLEVVDAYIRENTTDVVDPIDVQSKTCELRDKVDSVLKELETQIKVANATTSIEF